MNRIQAFPREVCYLNQLEYLSLRGNNISRFPDEICFLTNLKTLDLRGNPVDPAQVEILKVLLPRGCKILLQ
jgi:Leucine-rich repeat (LRR) protein